jgi:DNA repair protein RadA
MTNNKDPSIQFKIDGNIDSNDSILSYNKNGFDEFLSASDVLQNKKIEKFSTGSSQLDEVLGGGIETNSITQFYGPPGSGKSQICYALCSLLPKQYGSIYIDTEGKFRAERIKEIIKERNIASNNNDILKNIILSKVINHDSLEKAIIQVPKIIDSNNSIKLLIIDSLINHLRVEYPGRSQLPVRQQKLNIILGNLRKIANEKKVAVVITNHIQTNPDSLFDNNLETPVGGNVLNYACNHIIGLKKLKLRTCAILIKSGYLPENQSYFIISKKGLEDYIP